MKKITTITFSIIVVGILNNTVLAQDAQTGDANNIMQTSELTLENFDFAVSGDSCQITQAQRIENQKTLNAIKSELNPEEFDDFLANEPKECEFKKLAYRQKVIQEILFAKYNY